MENYKALLRSKEIGSNKTLLKKGLVPGIIYGKGSEPKKIAFENTTLQKLMQSGSFYTKIIDLEIEGEIEKILPKQLQYHPVTDTLIHFDFLRVKEDTKVTVEVPVDFLNQDICPGLKQGGVLNLVRRLVELSCNAIKISNIDLPEGVKPTIADRDFVVATLVPPTVEIEEETKPEEETEEGTDETTDEKEQTEDIKDKTEDKKEDSKEDSKEESK
jgi:large subunit ribosomal protein L25